RDDQELRPLQELAHHRGEARLVGVVERRVDLVEHAERRRTGREEREEERDRGERALAAGEQRERARILAGRRRDDVDPGLARLVALAGLQVGAAAAEEAPEGVAEVRAPLLERLLEARLALAVDLLDHLAQLRARLGQVELLLLQEDRPPLDRLQLLDRG